MEINIQNIKIALEGLKNLSEAIIIQKHPEAAALSIFISDMTHTAKKILEELVRLIEEEATIQFLIEQRKN